MTIFDLLFVLTAAGMLALVARAIFAFCRGRRRTAFFLSLTAALGAIAYESVVYGVTFVSERPTYEFGDAMCNDDWCISVERSATEARGSTRRYEVHLRIFSKARRRAQRELIAEDVFLVGADWNRYWPVERETDVPLDSLLQPLESKLIKRVFQVPAEGSIVGLSIAHRTWLPICLIINQCGAFHKEPLLLLE